jgi:thioredoxin-related protein
MSNKSPQELLIDKVKEKYGKNAVRPIRDEWSSEEEEEYQAQKEEYEERIKNIQNKKIIVYNGDDTCDYCGKLRIYFKIEDDVKIHKYGCCNTCYVNYIEDREDRWSEGWRPQKVEK